MSHTIFGELRKAPYVKTGCGQDGQSTMYIIELSEVIKDRKTGENIYTNYSACIFAKSGPQVDYYNTSLVEGNYVVVTGDKIRIDVSESNGKQYIKLQLEGAKLAGSKYIESNQQAPQQQGGFQPQQAPAQGGFQQQAQQQQGGFAPQQQQQKNPPRDNEGFTQAQGGFNNQG